MKSEYIEFCVPSYNGETTREESEEEKSEEKKYEKKKHASNSRQKFAFCL